jgi:hypothetical protein
MIIFIDEKTGEERLMSYIEGCGRDGIEIK